MMAPHRENPPLGVRRPWSWFVVLFVAACLAVLAYDVSSLEPYPLVVWRVAYGVAAFALVAWRIALHFLPSLTRRGIPDVGALIGLSMGLLFVSSWCRIAYFLMWQPERQAGMAINGLVAVGAAMALRDQDRWSRL